MPAAAAAVVAVLLVSSWTPKSSSFPVDAVAAARAGPLEVGRHETPLEVETLSQSC